MSTYASVGGRTVGNLIGQCVLIDPKTVHWYMNPLFMDEEIRIRVVSIDVVRDVRTIPYRYQERFRQGRVIRLEGDVIVDRPEWLPSLRRECWFTPDEADIRLVP